MAKKIRQLSMARKIGQYVKALLGRLVRLTTPENKGQDSNTGFLQRKKGTKFLAEDSNTGPLSEGTEIEVVLEYRGEDSNTSPQYEVTDIEVMLEYRGEDSNMGPLGEETEIEVLLEYRGEDSKTSPLGGVREVEVVLEYDSPVSNTGFSKHGKGAKFFVEDSDQDSRIRSLGIKRANEVVLEHSRIDYITSSGGLTEIEVVPVTDRPSLAFVVHAVILVVSVLLALVTLIITIAYGGAGHGSQISSPHGVCIDDVSTNWHAPEIGHLLKKLERTTVNGVPQVCAVTQDQLSALMELAMNPRKDKSEMNSPQGSGQTFTPVSAHKLLQAPDTDINVIEPTVIIEEHYAWLNADTNNSHIEHSSGVTVTKDSLLIQFSGLYYVYVGAYFKPKSDRPSREFDHNRWTLYIYRKSSKGAQRSNLLVQVAHSVCNNCSKNEESAFSGGSFYLQAGDHIKMDYAILGVIKFKTESTFLGLMMLESGERENIWF